VWADPFDCEGNITERPSRWRLKQHQVGFRAHDATTQLNVVVHAPGGL
jgi:hypothetical protein